MADAECEIDISRRTFLVPLDRDLYRKVESIARKRGSPQKRYSIGGFLKKRPEFLESKNTVNVPIYNCQ
jgi:hypothetical protein